MERDIQIWIEGSSVLLRAPWHTKLAAFAQQAGGKYLHADDLYAFPAELSEYVRAATLALFEDDGTTPLADYTLDCSLYSSYPGLPGIVLAGRTLVSRPAPSRRPKLGKGVRVVSGEFTFEGVFEPRQGTTIGKNDAVLLVTLPAALAARSISGLARVALPSREQALVAEGNGIFTRLQAIKAELADLRNERASA